MKRFFTLTTSDLSLLVTLTTILFVSCSTRVENEANRQAGLETAKIVKELPVITVAKLDNPATNQGYFDLIVETSNCLGENLWIGGKLESKTGETPRTSEYEVTQLTATGLSSNISYTFANKEGTIKAVGTDAGVVYLQLQEGLLQLQPSVNPTPIALAFHKQEEADSPGYWSCK